MKFLAIKAAIDDLDNAASTVKGWKNSPFLKIFNYWHLSKMLPIIFWCSPFLKAVNYWDFLFFLNQFHPGTSQPSIAEGSSESETKKRRMRRRPLRPKQRQSRRERLQSLKPRLPWTTQERMMGMMRRRRSIRMMMRSMMKMNTPLLSRRTWRMMSGARVGTRRRHGIRMKDATLAFRVRGAAADSCEWLHQCGFEVSCLGVRVSQHD